MKYLKANWLCILFCSLAFLFGFVVAKFLSFRYFQIDEKINLLDVCSLAMTIFLGIFISIHLERKNSSNRVEKDLIILKISEIVELLSRLQEELECKSPSLEVINSRLKSVSMSGKAIFKLIGKSTMNKWIEKERDFLEIHRDLRSELTQSPIQTQNGDASQNDVVRVENSCVYYPNSTRAQAEKLIVDLKDFSFELQLCINRA